MERSSWKVGIFWPVVALLVVADRVTKIVAEQTLWPRYVPRDVWGDFLRWTLVYNPGAAFGLHLGPYSRWIFMGLTVAALAILTNLYRNTQPGDRWRLLAVGLVTAGAVGNLIDRVISPNGVVDFIDVGIGERRWPTFNVADMAVSTGAILLAIVLWGEDRAAARSALASDSTPAT
ncbi:MAG: signal peptidase II [Gemmatimonadaceae bacterium]